MATPVDAAVLARADELHRRGFAANSAYKTLTADRLLRRALALIGVPTPDAPVSTDLTPEVAALVTRIYTTWARSAQDQYGFDAAMTALDRAEELARKYGPSEDMATPVGIANNRGMLLMRAGRTLEGLAVLKAAESDFALGRPLDNANVMLNQGAIRLNRGEVAQARAALTRAADLASRGAIPVVEGMARHNLGYAEFLAGNLVAALDAMTAAITAYPELPPAISGLDKARALSEAGLVHEADIVLAEVADLFARERDSQDLGETELERARCALITGDVAGSRRLAMRARDRFRRRANDTWRRNAELVLLQGDLAAGRPGSRLLDPALRLQVEFEEVGLMTPARTAGLLAAEAAVRAGRADHAGELLAGLRPTSRDPITTRVQARYVRARWELARGRPSAASREVRAGLRDLATYQARFGSIDLQTASAVHGRRLADVDVEIALAGGRPAAVFAAAERGRAASHRLVRVRPPADSQASAMLAELRQVGESLRAAGSDRVEAAALNRRRRELEREITARGWTVSGSGETREIAGIDEIRERLRRDASTLVSYVDVAGALHAVVVGSRLRLITLGPSQDIVELVRRLRADLDMLAQAHLPEAMRSAVTSSARRSAVALDAALVRPLALDATRLVIVSTGVLGQLPWAALASLRQVPVVVAPSATAWLAAASRRAARRRGVFALAGPDVASGPAEVRGVAKAWPGTQSRTGNAADRAALAEALGGGQIVHVAAHGVHQTENALFSSLRLADGMSFAHELDRTARTPDHVVLSACELGLATVRPGDEALGLTSVLLRLGTRSVVASVARVGDETAAATMLNYHRRLAAGEDSASALAMAVADVDDLAPFVAFGSAWSR